MFKTIILRFFLCFSFLVLIFSAIFFLKNDLTGLGVSSASSNDLNNRLEENYSPGFAYSSMRKLIYKASLDPNINIKAVLNVLDVYLKRNPLDANAWLVGSQFYQRAENIKASALYLDVAHRLSETNTPMLFKVFNRYLELGLIEKAMPVAHDIVLAKPSEFRRLFFLISRLNSDYGKVVEQVIPSDVDVYYEWALADSIRAKNFNLASNVWNAASNSFKSGNTMGLKYIDFLLESKKPELVEDAWLDITGEPMVVGQIDNQGGDKVTPCWQIKKRNAVDQISVSENGDSASIELVFSGDANINFNHLKCLVAVKPNTQYQLKGRTKGDRVSTLSGPYVDVFFPEIKKRYKSNPQIGSWDWTRLELPFVVPNDVYFMGIRIRRNKTKLLDSKISGTVWFDSFELLEIGSEKSQAVF